MNYGFVIDVNPYDRFLLDFDIPEDDSVDIKKTLLQKYNLSVHHVLRKGNELVTTSTVTVTKGPLSPNLLASLRICLMNEQEVLNLDDLDPFKRISHGNEEQVVTVLDSLLQQLISQLEEGIGEAQDSSKLQKLAIKYRNNQKDILKEAKCHLETLTATN